MATEFPIITLDAGQGDLPLPARIASAIRQAVAAGRLRPGDALPPSRALAGRLGVSRGSVTRAFDQLAAEGYVVANPGSYTRINPALAATPAPRADPPAHATRAVSAPAQPPATPPATGRGGTTSGRIDLRPGVRGSAPPDDPGWREAWRRASGPGHDDRLDPQGDLGLREAIAEHLRLMRSHVVDPDRMFITAGAREGLDVVLALLAERRGGPPRIGVEDPGFPGLRKVLARHAHPVPSRVDAGGIVVDALAADLDAVLVTPNHLFPLGEAMPATRRSALLRHAASRGLLVIEDDYDAEFRYLGPPLPSLASIADPASRVAHLGTFSHLLVRDAALGYLVLPPDLVLAARALRNDLGLPVSAIAQRAMADFLRRGGLRRHITSSRRRLSRRRAAVLEALGDLGVQAVAGAHALVPMPNAEATRLAVAGLEREGIDVGDLRDYWGQAQPGPADGDALAFSYDGANEEDLRRALGEIRRLLADTSPKAGGDAPPTPGRSAG